MLAKISHAFEPISPVQRRRLEIKDRTCAFWRSCSRQEAKASFVNRPPKLCPLRAYSRWATPSFTSPSKIFGEAEGLFARKRVSPGVLAGSNCSGLLQSGVRHPEFFGSTPGVFSANARGFSKKVGFWAPGLFIKKVGHPTPGVFSVFRGRPGPIRGGAIAANTAKSECRNASCT